MLNCTLNEIVTKLKNQSVTAKQLCSACLKRAEKTASLNAFITLTPKLAIDRATISDEKNENGTSVGLLEGIPVTFKDNFSTKGVQTSCGSHMLTGYKPPYNATVVQKMLDQGALLMGKTNMDEFAMGSGSIDSVFGPVKNPWGYDFSKSNTDTLSEEGSEQEDQDWRVAGGSSGGSAVAVAMGVCFAAIGSDTGGSTRLPAAYCGIVGLKPTYGRLSRNGLIPLVNSLEVPGIFTKTTEDAAVILNILSGHDVMDSTTVTDTHTPVQLTEDISLQGLTIGIPKEYHAPGLDGQVVEAWQRSADMFANGGAELVDASLPHSQYSNVCYHVLGNCEVASNMARFDGIEYGLRAAEETSTEALYAATRHHGFNEVVRGRILAGNYFLLKRNYDNYFVRAQKIRRLIQDDFKKVFNAGVDILLTPVVQSAAPKHSWFIQEDNRTRSEQEDIYTQPVNMAGLPAVTLPVCLSSEGLPISLQLIGRPFQEDRLLLAARWLERGVNFQRLNLDHLDLEPS